jgi:hypothetical protein
MSVHTDNLQGIASKGVTVYTNDPTTPQVFLSVKLEVVGSIKLLPMDALQLHVRPGESTGGRLLVRKDPTETGELKVGDLKSSAPWLSLTATRLTEATPHGNDGLPPGSPGDWVLEARVKDDAPPLAGRRHETITFSTALPRQPTATLPVILDLKPPVNLPVERLSLKPGTTGPAEGSTFISVRADLDPTALKIETRPAGLEAQAEPSSSPRILTLHVKWKGGPLVGGVVTMTVGEEKVRLPVEVEGTVQRPSARGGAGS